MKIIKAALVQQYCTGDKQENIERSIAGIEQAAQQGAELVLLPELHSTLYFCQTEEAHFFDLAESIPGATSDIFANIAKKLNIVLVVSLFEKRAVGLYHNSAIVLERDGCIVGKYRKMHIPDDPGYYEKYYFTPGDLGFYPIQTSVGKLGVLICWDQWFPEAARLMALAGADILLYPTAIGWNREDDKAEQQRQLEAWITIQRAHAIANGIPVMSCNRIGFEADPSQQTGGSQFWGHSFIAGAQGEIKVQAKEDYQGILIADIDYQQSENTRRVWPYLRDRRIDHYQELLKIYRDE